MVYECRRILVFSSSYLCLRKLMKMWEKAFQRLKFYLMEKHEERWLEVSLLPVLMEPPFVTWFHRARVRLMQKLRFKPGFLMTLFQLSDLFLQVKRKREYIENTSKTIMLYTLICRVGSWAQVMQFVLRGSKSKRKFKYATKARLWSFL